MDLSSRVGGRKVLHALAMRRLLRIKMASMTFRSSLVKGVPPG
jgi:hypothetical protein